MFRNCYSLKKIWINIHSRMGQYGDKVKDINITTGNFLDNNEVDQ